MINDNTSRKAPRVDMPPVMPDAPQKFGTFIFDLDGTLLDTLDDLTASVNAALSGFGLPLHKKDDIRSFVGDGIGKLIERALPNGKGSPAYRGVFELFKEHYALHCADQTKPYDGVIPMLRELCSRQKKIAVVSNKADFAVRELVRVFFEPFAITAVGEREGILRKPAPDMVLAVIRELCATPSDCLYIGDSEVDIQTAKNAGISCASALWGFRDVDFLLSNGAYMLAEKPEDILYLC